MIFMEITQFLQKMLISVKKTHVFRKGPSFSRFLRKRRTLPKGRICRFPQEFTKFQRKTHTFTKCSRKAYIFRKRVSLLRILRKRRTFLKGRIYRFPKNSLNFHKKTHMFRKIFNFCELCEKDARFPRV